MQQRMLQRYRSQIFVGSLVLRRSALYQEEQSISVWRHGPKSLKSGYRTWLERADKTVVPLVLHRLPEILDPSFD